MLDALGRSSKDWSETGLVQYQVVLILAPFVSPSVCLLIEKFSPMSSNVDKDLEEAPLHSGLKKPDDAAQYVPIWRVEEERVFALPNLIVSHCCQAFRVGEEGNGFVMDQRVLSCQTDSSEFRPARGASPCASTDPAATASSSVLPVKPRPYALGAMGAIRGARCPI